MNEDIEASSEDRILDAAIGVLGRDGVAGVSMRAVAREADVAVGLANYYFSSKTDMICAALRRIGERDLEIVAPADGSSPDEALRQSLHRALDAELLNATNLSLRLQLWSLAGVDPQYAAINQKAQERYLAGLAALLAAARPELAVEEVSRRAGDILIVQNGVWLTSILITDPAAVDRARARCEELAFT